MLLNNIPQQLNSGRRGLQRLTADNTHALQEKKKKKYKDKVSKKLSYNFAPSIDIYIRMCNLTDQQEHLP